MTGASYRNLLKWKDLPIAEAYVEEKVKKALAGTYNKLISAGPAVAAVSYTHLRAHETS